MSGYNPVDHNRVGFNGAPQMNLNDGFPSLGGDANAAMI